MDPGYGASIHYAGTLPFDETGKVGTLDRSGKLNGFENVYVADGSGFRYLPAKGITLSLMANAHRTALNCIG
jgi:choline dehydrogenase-like flavoprotein